MLKKKNKTSQKKKIINCCSSSTKDKSCKRETDEKIFNLPRKIPKEKCINGPIKGFTMRSSCAPYNDCQVNNPNNNKHNNNKHNNKKSSNQLNLNNKELEICSLNPKTGWFRDGKCHADDQDHGNHLICSTMTKEFLDYTKDQGNDLSTVVKPGQNWCLCQLRWNEAFKDGKEPLVVKSSSNDLILPEIKKNINKSLTRKKIKKK